MSVFSEVWLRLESWACASPVLGRLPWNASVLPSGILGKCGIRLAALLPRTQDISDIYI